MSEQTNAKKLTLCESIEYRKGAIEVSSGIHDNCVNIETWQVNPKVDLKNAMNGDFDLEGKVQANTELELDKAAALQLIEQLKNAVSQLTS